MTTHDIHMQLLNLEQKGLLLEKQILMGFPVQYNPEYDSWITSVSLYCQRFLSSHSLYSDISNTISSAYSFQQKMHVLNSLLNTIGKDDYYWENYSNATTKEVCNSTKQTYGYTSDQQSGIDSSTKDKIYNQLESQDEREQNTMNKKVFIVHGHDNAAKQELARVIEKIGFEAIILHEQADGGKTIIEKIETYSDVSFAVVLYTECDVGRAKEESSDHEQYRARQNVVFEHGYLIGKLGRERVCALVKGKVETPGDISGVIYTKMDADGAWKFQLVKNMNSAGLAVDANRLL